MSPETFKEIKDLFRHLSSANADHAQSDNGADVRNREAYYRRELGRILARQGCLCKIGIDKNE